MKNVVMLKAEVRKFIKSYEMIILDRIMDESIVSNDYDLYFSVCNKYNITPSKLIEELKKNDERNGNK